MINTYQDLADAIGLLTDEQRQKPVQIVSLEDDGEVTELLPIVCLGTVGGVGLYKCRSTYDNMYHGDDVVILCDYNCSSQNGCLGYELDGDDPTPFFGPSGPTPPELQWSPEALLDSKNKKSDK